VRTQTVRVVRVIIIGHRSIALTVSFSVSLSLSYDTYPQTHTYTHPHTISHTGTAIGRSYFLRHEKLGHVFLGTSINSRVDMNCSNNGLTFFDVSRDGSHTSSGVYISGTRVDLMLRIYNTRAEQYRAWEEWMRDVNKIASRGTSSDLSRSFHLNFMERSTLRVRLDREKSVSEIRKLKEDRLRRYNEMRHITSDTKRNGKIYAVCSEGGRGKTSTSIHTAGAFASLGKRVLLLDLDGQRNATCMSEREPSAFRSLSLFLSLFLSLTHK